MYLYEYAASSPERKNLATVRAGEYEGLPEKLANPNWKPDFGPAAFNERVKKTGVTAIGARDFLIAYNVNLNTTSTRWANAIAFDIREAGRVKREGDPLTGPIVKDEHGNPVRIPGALKACKAIGWYIEVWMFCEKDSIFEGIWNCTDIYQLDKHQNYSNPCCIRRSMQECSIERNSSHRWSQYMQFLTTVGSELVGLVPLQAMLDAGKYFLKKQRRSVGVSEEEIIKIAVKSLGLDDLTPFDPKKKIIEYMLEEDTKKPLLNMTLKSFANTTASEAPAPGRCKISSCA